MAPHHEGPPLALSGVMKEHIKDFVYAELAEDIEATGVDRRDLHVLVRIFHVYLRAHAQEKG